MRGRRPLQFRSIQFLVFVGFLWAPPSRLAAQDHDHSQMNQAPATTDWSWATDSNVIFGYNYQQRQFADFWAWESQNWVMLSGERKAGPGRLSVIGMMSFEPWTIGRLVYAKGDNGSPQRIYAFNANRERVPLGGSPQTFQTGESYLGAPLINYQHPHDLFMEIGATYRLDRGRIEVHVRGRTSSARRRSALSRSCTANRRATIRKRRSPITTSTRRTSRRVSSPSASAWAG